MRRLRVLVLMHAEFVPPDSTSGYTAQQIHEWKTEYDVVSTLRAAGHEVHPLGVEDELKPVRDGIEEFKPHVAFTLWRSITAISSTTRTSQAISS